jgi:RNA polymerase sigma factor (sigma-70 family)
VTIDRCHGFASLYRVIRYAGAGMATKLQPQFEGRGDVELLQLMAVGDSFAFDAWAELYTRHAGYLYAFCKNAFVGRVGGHRIDEIVQDALIKAFHKAATFQNEVSVDLDDQRRLVRAWLGTICNRIVSDYFRGQPLVDFMDNEALEAREAADAWTSPSETDSDGGERLRIIEDGLKTLSEREQEVLRTTLMWSNLGVTGKLPHKVMTDLTSSLKISPANVRKIRERGLSKLRTYVESHMQNSGE